MVSQNTIIPSRSRERIPVSYAQLEYYDPYFAKRVYHFILENAAVMDYVCMLDMPGVLPIISWVMVVNDIDKLMRY